MRAKTSLVLAVLAITLFNGGLVGLARQPDPSSSPQRIPAGPPASTINFRGFVRVIDGDTIEINLKGRRVGIGILGIDAPQGNTPCGRQATNALRQLFAGGLTLDDDPDTGLQ